LGENILIQSSENCPSPVNLIEPFGGPKEHPSKRRKRESWWTNRNASTAGGYVAKEGRTIDEVHSGITSGFGFGVQIRPRIPMWRVNSKRGKRKTLVKGEQREREEGSEHAVREYDRRRISSSSPVTEVQEKSSVSAHDLRRRGEVGRRIGWV